MNDPRGQAPGPEPEFDARTEEPPNSSRPPTPDSEPAGAVDREGRADTDRPDSMGQIVVVLDHPKDVVNIAGVLRVMMNFGVSRLRLVQPDEFDAYRIEGIAHRSMPLIEATTIHDTLEDALADTSFVLGTTARARTAGRTYTEPRIVAPDLAARAREGSVAIVFGREDRGLSNAELDLCHQVAIIPTDPEYSSLNLAQASLVLLYEVFLAAEGGLEELPRGRRATRQPTHGELEQTFEALALGLERIEFYKARKPSAVMRTIRTLIHRAHPDLREARLLAAIGWEIVAYMDRNLPDRGTDAAAAPRERDPGPTRNG